MTSPDQVIPDPASWTRCGYAIVASNDTISFIRDPGDATDDALRALVNAPADAVIVRQFGTDPDFTVANWECDVCGGQRLYAQISVAPRPALFAIGNANAFTTTTLPGQKYNVRYCNDRPQCTEVATNAPTWPPEGPVAGWCIPTQDRHADPHRGCEQLSDPLDPPAATANGR